MKLVELLFLCLCPFIFFAATSVRGTPLGATANPTPLPRFFQQNETLLKLENFFFHVTVNYCKRKMK